jgi:hypothetical protein
MKGGLCLALALVLASAGEAQAPPHKRGDVKHEVRQGDTLENLAQRYLGDHARWIDIHRANPDITDPHRIAPGTIIVIPAQLLRAAEIMALARKVEAKAEPDPAWAPARVGGLLKQRDGLRTYRRSSADLAFDDGSRLVITEDSLVFLREEGARLKGAVAPRPVEIVEGQADLDARPPQGARPEIEILVAGSRTRPRAGEDGSAQARARRTSDGAAQVMVYGGSAELEAAGRAVEVPAGMGSAVPPGGPPGPPERLLAAVRALAPEPNALVDHANPRFQWEALPGAASYSIEICRDPACAELVIRAVRLTGNRWQAEALPMGRLYYRVTASSRSGLDGFPGKPVPFVIESLWRRPDRRGEAPGG